MSRLEYQRKKRLETNNKYTKKYERTVNGFLVRKYRNMQSRVEGVQYKKSHLYEGLELLERDDFYAWSKNNPDFKTLYSKWVESNFERRLCPSVNRIDPLKGYTLENMEWITFSENCRKTSRNGY